MLPAFENSVAALEDEMWADRVLSMVQALIESLLLREEHDGAVVLRQAGSGRSIAALIDSLLNIAPNIRRIVSIEVNDRFWCSVETFTGSSVFGVALCCGEIARDLIEIFLISHWANNVDDFVEWHGWVLLEVGVDLVP